MDRFYRKICLEDFRNRMFNTESGETEWGAIAHDYFVSDNGNAVGYHLNEIADNIPLKDNRRLRYGTFILLYSWLKNIIKNSKFYYVCNRSTGLVWAECEAPNFEDPNEYEKIVEIGNELPSVSHNQDIFWLTEDADELNERFTASTADTVHDIVVRITDVFAFYQKIKNKKDTINTGVSYMDIDVMLTSDCYDMGAFTKYPTTAETKTVTSKEKSFIGESKLKSLMRHKKSYDDDGSELPFYFNGTSAEFLYVTGTPYNVSVSNGVYTCDYISRMTTEGMSVSIFFEYYIGAKINSNGEIVTGTGIHYEERYPLDAKTITFNYDGRQKTISYDEIVYNEQNRDTVHSMISSNSNTGSDAEEWTKFKKEHFEAGKQYAKITYLSEFITEDTAQWIMEDALFGITDINQSGAPRIERGTSAAFELHNILGECRSMDDLENYRNHFLAIKDIEKE